MDWIKSLFTFKPVDVHWLDVTLIIVYLLGMIGFGWYFSRRVKTSEDYFLGGRSLPWWIIGMSIIGSNIGSNDYVGAAGGAGRVQALTERDQWIASQVGPTLRERGLYFVGLDVIGDYLTEINVTSPTCLREIEAESGLDIAGQLLDSLPLTEASS